jgi:cold shock protein
VPAEACLCGGVPSTALGAAKEAAVMATGTVKWFDSNRGYGFIRPERGEDVFVHISAVEASGLQTLQEGQAVEFDIEQGRKGPQAANLRPRQGQASG